MATVKARFCGRGNALSFWPHRTVIAVLFLLWLHPALYAGSEAAANPAATSPANASSQNRGRQTDFLFDRPKGFIGFRFGRLFPRADSEVFDMITDQLTLEKSDFHAIDFGIDGGFDLQERVDLIFSFDYAKTTVDSEFRDYEDERGLPITQTTSLEQLPLTGGVKFLILPRGRKIGSFSWIPNRVVPFVGAGAGVLWYRLEQKGDFVDFETYEIFSARLESNGWTPTAYAGGGADINIAKGLFLTLDLRYFWAETRLKRDFVGFDKIDLAGLRATAGLQWHF